MKPRAIILECHYNGLGLLQELARNGVRCVAMDSRRSIGTFSKYARFHRCPDPAHREDEFIRYLIEFCKREKEKPVLFPTSDSYAAALARHRDRIAEVAIPCVGSWESVGLFLEKDRFYRKGYDTPKTWLADQVSRIPENAFPIVAKPGCRKRASNKNESKRAAELNRLRLVVLQNHEELEVFLIKEEAMLDDLIFQEFIPGMSDEMYSVGIYADAKSELLGIFTGRKVRGFPAQSGDCMVGECHAVPVALIQGTRRIVRETGFSGIAEFEFKRNPETDDYSLMEVNPRSWSWIGITPFCGASIPLIAYRDLTGESVSFARSELPDGSVNYVRMLDDLWNCRVAYRWDYPAWVQSFSRWRKGLNSDRTIYADFTAGDWPVALVSLLNAVGVFFRECGRAIRSKL